MGDEVHRRARIKAAARATSVSAVVREFLINRSGEETEFERRKRLPEERLPPSTRSAPEIGCQERRCTGMPAFVDTNLLLYFVNTTASEASKRSTARTILDRDDLVLSAQVLQS